ncbi:hypothetical protein DL96DRAFT_541432 [Flagelloscypha sp. PMI_526]|nr:hypothetical protein DL96DRAFT_541432 [Flagelloscypha sp. PMI_526]
MSDISKSSSVALPIELVFVILELALQSTREYGQKVKFLSLSRSTYDLIIPKFYLSLDLQSAYHPRSSYSVDRTLLLSTAQRSNLLHTRFLISRSWTTAFSFVPFSRLSYLFLWGQNNLFKEPHGHAQAREIVMLPIEELVIWQHRDGDILLKYLTKETLIWKTLQRLGLHADRDTTSLHESWMFCPNLAQVLVFCYDLVEFFRIFGPRTVLPSSPLFQSFIILPFSGVKPSEVQTVRDALRYLTKDRRMVVYFQHLDYLLRYPTMFWVNQRKMWNFMSNQVEKNLNTREITVLENTLFVTEVDGE